MTNPVKTLVLALGAALCVAAGMFAQAKINPTDPQPTCEMCPGTYIPLSELDAYTKKAMAEFDTAKRKQLVHDIQRYEGGRLGALEGVPDGHRKVASISGSHELSLTPRLTVGYGTKYESYDYLQGYGLLSPSLRASFAATPNVTLHAKASMQQVAPGAEEFVPPADAQWVPPQRTFAPLGSNGFSTERVQHYEVGAARQFRAAAVSVLAFQQVVDDQLVTVFGAADPGRLIAPGGHYGSSCASCHSPGRPWSSATFSHPSVTHGYRAFPCAKCHPGGYRSHSCTTCHGPGGSDGGASGSGLPPGVRRRPG